MWRTALAGIAVACLGWAAAAWLTHDFQVYTAEGARRLEVALAPVAAPGVELVGPGFELAGPGGPRTLPELLRSDAGATIADFVYTRCVSVCAALGSSFQQLQARILDEAQRAPGHPPVRLLSISFDARHDDVAALGAYARGLRADPDVWRFATVSDAQSLETLLSAFQVVVIADALGGYEHNAALLVLDSRGRLVRIFDAAQIDDAWAFARELARRERRA